MTLYGFYKDNQLVYVGQTTMKVEDRINKHFNSAKVGRNLNMLIVRSIRKYGKDCFDWKILKTCNCPEELNNLEIEYISKHKPKYNIQPGGKNSKLAESTKKKISEVQKKRILCVDDQICFFSVIEAESFYGAGKGTIGRVARGQRNSYRGKKFEFINTKSLKGRKSRD